MAKVTLKDSDSKPKKFNKTVVLELTPREAVLVTTLVATTVSFPLKSRVYDALMAAGVPYISRQNNVAVWDGVSLLGAPQLRSDIESIISDIAEDAN